MLGLRKPNFKTKIIRFEKSHNAENCKRGTFLNIHFVAKFQKIEARVEKKFQKKTRILNSLIVPKNLKEGTHRDFLTFVLLQNTKKMKGHEKKLRKKSQSRNNMHKKIWSRARLEPAPFCLADLKKS